MTLTAVNEEPVDPVGKAKARRTAAEHPFGPAAMATGAAEITVHPGPAPSECVETSLPQWRDGERRMRLASVRDSAWWVGETRGGWETLGP